MQIALEKDLDVVLLAVRMRDDGLEALERIKVKKPDLPVLMFSVFDDPAAVAEAVSLGANGFLLKGCEREELLGAIRTVAGGGRVWTEEQLRGAGDPTGQANTRIAAPGISGDTVSHLLRKLGAHDLGAR